MKAFDLYITTDEALIESLDKQGIAHLPRFDVAAICALFKEHGFNVTAEAVEHNREAWSFDEKSGYRDEANGYHLFSPCGCNPFSVRAIELEDGTTDHLTTYTA